MRSPAPTVRARQLGAELRRSRAATGLGAPQVAQRLGFSMSKLSRIENGQRGPKVEDVAGLLALYGVTGEARAELLELCREVESGQSGWWQRREMTAGQRTLIELESTATQIINYETFLIPGLLQTGEYTRAVLRDVGLVPAGEIEDRMVTRLARHAVLRKQSRPRFSALVHEIALQQLVGGADVMRRQLDYLLYAANLDSTSVRVVPSAAGIHPGLLGPFAKIEFGDASPVVFVENRTSQLFIEDRQDVDYHNEVLRKIIGVSLDTRQSVELIAKLAVELDRTSTEENVHAEDAAPGLAQEQS